MSFCRVTCPSWVKRAVVSSVIDERQPAIRTQIVPGQNELAALRQRRSGHRERQNHFRAAGKRKEFVVAKIQHMRHLRLIVEGGEAADDARRMIGEQVVVRINAVKRGQVRAGQGHGLGGEIQGRVRSACMPAYPATRAAAAVIWRPPCFAPAAPPRRGCSATAERSAAPAPTAPATAKFRRSPRTTADCAPAADSDPDRESRGSEHKRCNSAAPASSGCGRHAVTKPGTSPSSCAEQGGLIARIEYGG